jgi:hypothetical protein
MKKGGRSSVRNVHAGRLVIDIDDTIRVGKRQRLQKYRFNHAEDRSVGRNAERQGEHHERREREDPNQGAEKMIEPHDITCAASFGKFVDPLDPLDPLDAIRPDRPDRPDPT